MQDTNPLKSAALKEALRRYEESLKKENGYEGVHLKDHQHKVEFDQEQLNIEKETKLRKQMKFKKEIQEQMELNVSAQLSPLTACIGATPRAPESAE